MDRRRKSARGGLLRASPSDRLPSTLPLCRRQRKSTAAESEKVRRGTERPVPSEGEKERSSLSGLPSAFTRRRSPVDAFTPTVQLGTQDD